MCFDPDRKIFGGIKMKNWYYKETTSKPEDYNFLNNKLTRGFGYILMQSPELTADLLSGGIFDIGKNLMELDADASINEKNAFSEFNMIQTNISFTDAGTPAAWSVWDQVPPEPLEWINSTRSMTGL